VFVKEHSSKRVYVIGHVKRPGTFKFRTGLNIVEAITLAQGFSGAANSHYVVVTRRKAGKDVRYPVNVSDIQEGEAPNFLLHAGDIVFVPDRLL
jgi:polysaccharide export outer membrane protein